MRRSSKRIWAVSLAAGGLVAGVATVIGATPGSAPPAVADELTPFDDCEQLRSWYVDTALPHVTAWGWDTDGPIMYDVMPMPDATRAAEAPAAEAPAVETDAVANGPTGTNLQEIDVDEPDLAKTDGELVALIRGGNLVVYDASGDQPSETGRVQLADHLRVTELLLVGDHAVLLGSATTPTMFVDPPIGVPEDEPASRGYGAQPPEARTTITTVDLTDPSAPSVQRTETMHGELVTAREHDGMVRVVTTWLPDFDFVQPLTGLTPKQALAKNRALVRGATAADWLPSSRIDGAATEELLFCADVRHPERPAGVGTISVVTMDPAEPETRTATGVAAEGNLTYSSSDRLYVATADDGWSDWAWGVGDRVDDPTTDIHAFDVTGDETTYVASGEVSGRVEDRWAFSEDAGLLRVASTTGQSWQPDETRVTILEERAGALEPIGSVGGMGKGEHVEAVRWFGDIAVVVTFRQIDPLYTLDLSDPTDPLVMGELKIPGFSAYLHPLDDDLLLGVGQGGSRFGILNGSQVSTFDLGDLATPSRLDQLGLGRGRTSAVESDSRAFSYLPDERLAFVPTTSWRTGDSLEVVRIDTDGTLSPATSIELPGWSGDARALPLDDGRVAVVAAGDLVQIVDPSAW
jgi:hypothetical protein